MFETLIIGDEVIRDISIEAEIVSLSNASMYIIAKHLENLLSYNKYKTIVVVAGKYGFYTGILDLHDNLKIIRSDKIANENLLTKRILVQIN